MTAEVHHVYLEYDVKADLTLHRVGSALEAISSQYRRLSNKNSIIANQETDLYLEQLSMNSPLRAKLAVAANTIAMLGTQLYLLGNIYNFSHDILSNIASDLKLFSGQEINAEKKFSNSELDDYQNIIKPITLSQGSKLNILGKDESKTTVNINVGWESAHIIENRIREYRKLNTLPNQSEVYQEVLLYIYTAVDKTDGENVGDKGIIDDIYRQPLKLIFPEERPDIKQAILHNNPFKHAFLVTVVVLHVENKPIAYKIIELHSSFPR